MIENFAAFASDYQHGRTLYNHQMRVTKMSLDVMEESGQAMVKMLDELPKGHVSAKGVDTYA